MNGPVRWIDQFGWRKLEGFGACIVYYLARIVCYDGLQVVTPYSL